MSISHYDTTPRRRWYQAYHQMRLLRRQMRENRLFKAHFWQGVIAGLLVFWAVVAYGLHSV